MALVKCLECSRDVSDKAVACPGCGSPVEFDGSGPVAPSYVSFQNGMFNGTRPQLVRLATAAINELDYRLDSVDEAAGVITFTTGVTMGSWSGVSGSIQINEVAPFRFEVIGKAKQNIKGGQLIALNILGEAQGKIQAVIDRMKVLAGALVSGDTTSIDGRQADADSGFIFLVMGILMACAFAIIWASSMAR